MNKTHDDAVRLIKALLGTKPRRPPLTDAAYLLEELPRITARSTRYASGYMIDVIEFQQRGLPHARMAIRLACAPREMNVHNTTGEVKKIPWIDQFICARKPAFEVLEEYCVLIRKPNVASTLPADYHYDVHPEIVAELMVREGPYFGRSITPTEFQRYMCRLVLNRESCAPALYGGGPHEHGPHLNPTAKLPDPTCTKGCKRGKCKLKSDGVVRASPTIHSLPRQLQSLPRTAFLATGETRATSSSCLIIRGLSSNSMLILMSSTPHRQTASHTSTSIFSKALEENVPNFSCASLMIRAVSRKPSTRRKNIETAR